MQYVIRPQSGHRPEPPRLPRLCRHRRPVAFSSPVTRLWCCPPASPPECRGRRPRRCRWIEAFPPQSVTISLADDIDVSRGDMLCRPNNRSVVGQDIDAMVCWFSERSSLGREEISRTPYHEVGDGTGASCSNTGWTSTRCIGTRGLSLCRSTRSAESGCEPNRRSCSIPTGATGTGSFILIDPVTNEHRRRRDDHRRRPGNVAGTSRGTPTRSSAASGRPKD